jgi:hypothetical protein
MRTTIRTKTKPSRQTQMSVLRRKIIGDSRDREKWLKQLISLVREDEREKNDASSN